MILLSKVLPENRPTYLLHLILAELVAHVVTSGEKIR